MQVRAWLAVAGIAACGGSGAPGDAGVDRVTVVALPATPNADLDLLVLIDDSGSTAEIQLTLANAFASFIATLATRPGGLPDLHLGVVTPDMGTSASGSATPAPPIGQIGTGGCDGTGKNGVLQVGTAQITGNFVADIRLADGSRQTNYSGTLADTFTEMTHVGSGGCGFEQPLRAVRAALDGNPANAGFVRAGALLGVVLLMDEDDCSAKDTSLFSSDGSILGPLQSFRCTRFGVTCAVGGETPDAMNEVGPKSGCGPNASSSIIDDVAPLRDFLVALKGDPHDVFVAAIAGTPEPVAVELRAPPGGGSTFSALAHSCSFIDPLGLSVVADPGVRLAAFADLFPDTNVVSTVCQPDLSATLGVIGQLAANASGSACLRAELPPEPDCVAEDVIGDSVTPIPPCGAPTCWRIETDPACPLAAHQKLVIDRAVPPDPQTFTRLRCAR
jgi:hypothetical protein